MNRRNFMRNTAAAKDAGLAIHSSHFDWDCVINPKDAAFSDFAKVIDQAKAISLTDLVIPFLQKSRGKRQ